MSLEIDPRVARRGLTCKFTTGAILPQCRKYCFTILLIDRIFLQPYLYHINAAKRVHISPNGFRLPLLYGSSRSPVLCESCSRCTILDSSRRLGALITWFSGGNTCKRDTLPYQEEYLRQSDQCRYIIVDYRTVRSTLLHVTDP
jgi:hypothetical protein